MARVLFHIDLNAFFAAAEELRHPELAGKPLAVGSLSSRGVLSTANYAAREKGVHSAMPVYMALEKCPELVIVPGDHAYYKELSGKFFALLKRFSPMLEPLSIDECFLDVTEPIRQYKRPLDLAVQIQQAVRQELGLSCSIGVAPNRFLAKMASDMRKPMGITVLRRSELAAKLYPLPIGSMIGVGKKTLPLLEKAGITTIGDLVLPENEQKVHQILGRHALPMILRAKGQSSDELVFSTSRKSLSVSNTYPSDIYTLEETLFHLRELTGQLHQTMVRRHAKARMVSVVFRDTRFKNTVRSVRLPEYTNDFSLLYGAVTRLAEAHFVPDGYRHLGVSAGSLLDADEVAEQGSLFAPPADVTQDIVEKLNGSLDANVFMKASDLLKKEKP